MKKKRLDLFLVEQGFYSSRSKAQAAIMAGQVLVANEKIHKPGTLVAVDAEIRLLGEKLPYVSRGGLKLAKALQVFSINLQGKICADIGASTGGFTDCALQNGAAKVYAIDVGYGQLAWQLRNDSRVVCLERCNARYLQMEQLGEPVDVATIDVAFIGLANIFPAVSKILKKDALVIALVKPQFEAGREYVNKKGLVRDAAIHQAVIKKVIADAEANGFCALGLDYSPIKGAVGNIEYLLCLKLEGVKTVDAAKISTVVERSHRLLENFEDAGGEL